MKKNRIYYLDELKTLCMLLVIYAHTTYISNNSVIGNIMTTLTWIAVPIFMMITGGIYLNKEKIDNKKYFIKLIKMYFVLCLWRFIYLIYGILMDGVSYGIAQCVQYTFLFLDYPDIKCVHTWYMMAYTISFLLYPVFHYLFNDCNGNGGRKMLTFVAAICLFSGIAINDLDWWLEKFLDLLSISKLPIVGIQAILPFTNYANMIFYYILGGFLYKYRDDVSDYFTNRKYLLCVTFIISCSMLLIIKYIETGSFAWNGLYVTIGYNRIATIFMAVSIYIMFYLWKDKLLFLDSKICKLINRNTLGIYYIHPLIIDIARKLVFSSTPSMPAILSLFYSVVIAFICAIIIILLKKIPFFGKTLK